MRNIGFGSGFPDDEFSLPVSGPDVSKAELNRRFNDYIDAQISDLQNEIKRRDLEVRELRGGIVNLRRKRR